MSMLIPNNAGKNVAAGILYMEQIGSTFQARAGKWAVELGPYMSSCLSSKMCGIANLLKIVAIACT